MTELTNYQIAASNMTANMIWSAAYEQLLSTVKGFKTYSRTPAFTIQKDDLPLLAIYLLRDREQPDSSPYMGEPKFREFCHLGIAGMILQSNLDMQLEVLAAKVMATRLALYTNPKFMKLISGFESSDTRLVFSKVGELPVAEYQMELVMSFETVWPPDVRDDYLMLHLETRFPTYDTDPKEVLQIIRTWDIPQN
jgi:hypothetical protein